MLLKSQSGNMKRPLTAIQKKVDARVGISADHGDASTNF